MANAIITSHLPTTSNVILTSVGFPAGPITNGIVASHHNVAGPGASIAGSVLTINGSGFGTRAAAPLVYDNFEAGADGDPIDGEAPTSTTKSGGTWTWGTDTSGTHIPRYSSSNARGASSINALCRYGSASGSSWNCSLVVDEALPDAGDELFFSFWWRYENTTFANTGVNRNSRNTKPFDFWPQEYGNSPFLYIGMGNPTYGDSELRFNGQTQYVPWYGGMSITDVDSEWIRYDVYVKQCTTGSEDGEARVYVHRTGTPAVVSALHASATGFSGRSAVAYFSQLWLGAYSSTEETDTSGGNLVYGDVHMDNIYIDSTRMRVELGDASTWGACTRREIQPSTAWSDTSITALYQQGLLPSGTAYAYVVGSSGSPVNTDGYPVTLP